MRLRAWTRRNSDGRLANPRCVRAHLEEILICAPGLLTQSDIEYIKRYHYS